MDSQVPMSGGTEHSSRPQWYVVWGAVILAIAAVAASFFIVRGVSANADYICTHIIEDRGDCTNGTWGDWVVVSTSAASASCEATVERRVYTGVRSTRHILQYLTGRTQCTSDYSQVTVGNGNTWGEKWSGFHGGSIVTQSSACQIEETRTQCGPTETPTVISTQTDLGALSAQSSAVSSQDELTQFRISMIAANIYAVPALVTTGATALVRWQTREVTACTVTATNGDQWQGTAGEKTSSPIVVPTTYTLTCTAFNGQIVTDQATVGVIPIFQEQ